VADLVAGIEERQRALDAQRDIRMGKGQLPARLAAAASRIDLQIPVDVASVNSVGALMNAQFMNWFDHGVVHTDRRHRLRRSQTLCRIDAQGIWGAGPVPSLPRPSATVPFRVCPQTKVCQHEAGAFTARQAPFARKILPHERSHKNSQRHLLATVAQVVLM